MAKCGMKNEPVYILELSKLEAETLYRLLGFHTAGSGLRQVTDGIYHALVGHGFSEIDIECKSDLSCVHITEELPK